MIEGRPPLADPAGPTRVRSRHETRPARTLSLAEAAPILASRDPVLARLIEQAGPIHIRRLAESRFAALVRLIVCQQLAEPAAASATFRRLIAALRDELSPQAVLELSDDGFRAAGLSPSKVLSLRDLAAKLLDGTLTLSTRGLARRSDAEIAAMLSKVRGIGRWSTQMFLIFELQRHDVWPVTDPGVCRGYGLAWKILTPSPRKLGPLGDPFRPYRTVLTWYCWRAAELLGGITERAYAAAGREPSADDRFAVAGRVARR